MLVDHQLPHGQTAVYQAVGHHMRHSGQQQGSRPKELCWLRSSSILKPQDSASTLNCARLRGLLMTQPSGDGHTRDDREDEYRGLI